MFTIDQIVRCHKATMKSKQREKIQDVRLARAAYHTAKGKDFEDALKPIEKWIHDGHTPTVKGKNDMSGFKRRIGSGF